MKIIGFNFNKINIEKFIDKVENIKINTKIDVSEITMINSDFLKTKEEIIGIIFNYEINYDPNFAKISFAGNILFSIKSKKAKEILKLWKDKKIPEDFKITLFNTILRKSNIKALQLEDEMNLPLHISLPSLKKQEAVDKKEQK